MAAEKQVWVRPEVTPLTDSHSRADVADVPIINLAASPGVN